MGLLVYRGSGMREALTWNQAVQMLIEVGRHPALGDPECGPWLEPLRDLDDRRLLTRWSIQRTMSELTLEECVALVRALTVCEESLRWRRGSVSVVIAAFKVLRMRDEQVALEQADWIMATSDNGFVPFGRGRGPARSVAELHAWDGDQSADAEARQAKASEQHWAAAERRRLQQPKRDEHRAASAAAAARRRRWLPGFSAMSLGEQLQELALRQDLHVNSFPDVFAGVDTAELARLDPEVLRQLSDRIRERREPRWRALAAMVRSFRYMSESD